MLPAELHVPFVGLYSSALASGEKKSPVDSPPATSTSPSGRSVAVCQKRAAVTLPVMLHALPTGS